MACGDVSNVGGELGCPLIRSRDSEKNSGFPHLMFKFGKQSETSVMRTGEAQTQDHII